MLQCTAEGLLCPAQSAPVGWGGRVNVPCRKIMDISISYQWLSNQFLAQFYLVELQNCSFARICRNEDSLTTFISPWSKRNHIELETQEAYLASGDTQAQILGFEIKH